MKDAYDSNIGGCDSGDRIIKILSADYTFIKEPRRLIMPKPDFDGALKTLQDVQKWYECKKQVMSADDARQVAEALAEIKRRMSDIWRSDWFCSQKIGKV
ncbi:Uncharacterised protein [uncultured archaeon]|nr:Uncharacterised protein [uncultured archaeon]